MVTVWNFQIVSNKFNVDRICTYVISPSQSECTSATATTAIISNNKKQHVYIWKQQNISGTYRVQSDDYLRTSPACCPMS
jgi:hypothetical protein